MEAPARPLVAPSAVSRGRPYPLGATWDGAGVNFALFSEHAERVELCLLDARGRRELERIELRERSDFVWHCYLPEARPGLCYAWRVQGPQDAERGHRFDSGKLLLDPYARMIKGGRAQVVDLAFSWGDDRRPHTSWHDSVIYELHVRGFTQRLYDVPDQLRGTYAGLSTEPAIQYLKRLGITAIELLPIHTLVDEKRLVQNGLRNYWGYNSIGYFAPEMRYSASGTLGEFKTMVKTLHAAGIEVILDVVYNHTGEGDHAGPTLSFRGIDNAVYYRLDPQDRRRYVNLAGTGNTFNLGHPAVLALVMDSLRYWVEEMHVDGFRFDLAAALVRDSAFLAAVRQDPVVSQVKLIAEPWDLGEGGYRLGSFPPGWSEWNDKYRDTVRSYWRGDEGKIGELAARISGSQDLFKTRSPRATINYVTAHDGFTLLDLLTYERKRNEANLEENRDGSDNNRSWDAGEDRPKQQRNLLATLLFSQGVPMLVAGDEIGRTQLGNNNAYCQDNEVSWLDWDKADTDLLEFVRQVISLRKKHPLLRRRTYPRPEDTIWLSPDGHEMSEADWKLPFARCLGMLMGGELLLLLNAHHEAVFFRLPEGGWSVTLDTGRAAGPLNSATYALEARSLALLVKHLAPPV